MLTARTPDASAYQEGLWGPASAQDRTRRGARTMNAGPLPGLVPTYDFDAVPEFDESYGVATGLRSFAHQTGKDLAAIRAGPGRVSGSGKASAALSASVMDRVLDNYVEPGLRKNAAEYEEKMAELRKRYGRNNIPANSFMGGDYMSHEMLGMRDQRHRLKDEKAVFKMLSAKLGAQADEEEAQAAADPPEAKRAKLEEGSGNVYKALTNFVNKHKKQPPPTTTTDGAGFRVKRNGKIVKKKPKLADSDSRKRRAVVVQKVMKENPEMSLGEASKYVKEKGIPY